MSSSDNDNVLRASLNTLKNFQNSSFKYKNYSAAVNFSDIVPDSAESCDEISSSADSGNSESKEFENKLNDSKEYAESIEKIHTVDRMYRDLKEKWETKDVSDIETYLTEYYADILEPSRIRKTIENMKTVISHIQTIDEKRSKLKQVLRRDVSNDVWLIKRDYHTTVVNLFRLVSLILKKIKILKEVLENRKTFNPNTKTLVAKKELQVLEVLHESMDEVERLSNFLENQSHTPRVAENQEETPGSGT